ncbi:MAG: DUF1778 domain-containing protein [Myxococcaceae bacterium]|nr:DUF1778 domain-containing protein [Myxococcaceae bacterium]
MAERTQRLDFRLKATHRKLIERAAGILGQPLTSFAVQTLVEQAERVIAEEAHRKLTARDWKRFLQILDQDEVPPALARAVKRRRTAQAR